MKKYLLVLLVVAMVGVSCAGSSDTESVQPSEDLSGDVDGQETAASEGWDETQNASSFSPEVVDTVDALIRAHGDRALEVLLFALERGYTFDQLMVGATTGVIGDDGSLTDGTTPDRAQAGIMLLPEDDGDREGALGLRIEGSDLVLEPAVRRAQPSVEPGQLTVDKLRHSLSTTTDTPDQNLLRVIVGWVVAGFSLEQITDAIVFGTGIPVGWGKGADHHMCMVDLDGVVITPAVPVDRQFCADRTLGRSPEVSDADPDEPIGPDVLRLDELPDGDYPVTIALESLDVVEEFAFFTVSDGEPSLDFSVVFRSHLGECVLTSSDSYGSTGATTAQGTITFVGQSEDHDNLAIDNCGRSFTAESERISTAEQQGQLRLEGDRLVGSVVGYSLEVDLSSAAP